MWLKEEMKKHYSEAEEEEEEAQVTDIYLVQWGNDNFLSDDLMVSCF